MDILLTIVAAILLLAVLLVALPLMLIRWKIRKFLEALNDSSDPVTLLPPFRIELHPDNAHQWLDQEEVDRLAGELDRLGFVRIGTFSTEPATLTHEAWHLPDQNVYATMFEGPARGIWIDLLLTFEDDCSLTVTSAEEDFLATPDRARIVRIPHADPSELLERLREERDDREARPTSADSYPGDFEDVWKRTMDFQVERGGPSADEIRHAANRLGLSDELSEEETEQTVTDLLHVWERAISGFRSRQLREKYQSSLSTDEWELVRDRIVFLHDAMHPQELNELIDHQFSLEDQAEDDEQTDELLQRLEAVADQDLPRAAFSRMNAELHESCQFQPIGMTTDPIPADIYLAPECSADER
jgi:hypothetical protein